jgi:hypothetical protein
MRKLSLKKIGLTVTMAGLLATGYSRIDKTKKFNITSAPDIVKNIVESINSGISQVGQFVSNAFAPTGTYGGVVFSDNDGSGAKNGTEANIAGVTVNLYEANSTTPCGTTTSTTTGWTVTSATCTGQVRVEFIIPNSSTSITGLVGSDYSAPGAGSVQFASEGTNINFGIMNPDMFCQANPKLATPMYQAAGTAGLSTLQTWSYNNTGFSGDATSLATNSQTGATWGLAYDRVKRNLYTAAVLKTHTPLGPEGLDAIYVTNTVTGAVTKFVELTEDLGIPVSGTSAEPQYASNATRLLTDTAPENDAQAFLDVGKVGLGDIDLSTDGKTLYVVNLFNRTVYAIGNDPLDTANYKKIVGTYPVPAPSGCSTTYRPWGLAVQNGQVFVGSVCENASNAYVYELVGGTFTQVLTFALNYNREPPHSYGTPTCDAATYKNWKPWITTATVPATCAGGVVAYATPILTDIEFDANGNMILGFTDRTGFQFENENYGPTGTTITSLFAAGDILRACVTSTGTAWNIESSTCASTTGGPNNNGGNAIFGTDPNGYTNTGAKPGEFFWGDYFHADGGINGDIGWYPSHGEISIGGLAVLPGSNEVMTTAYDPVTGGADYNRGGVISLSTTNGARSRQGFQLYATSADATAGKGVGLGDLEILCDPAPIELGNRMWRDTDGDGIQEPDEPVLANVTLEIFVDANMDGIPDGPAIGTTTTTATGSYAFNAANVADGDPSLTGNQAGPQSGQTYIIRVASSDWTGGSGTGDLAGFGPTTANVGGTGQPDLRDSDATVVGGNLQISVTTGPQGASNHSLDFGLVPVVSIGSTVFKDVNNDGIQNPTETGLAGAVVKLYAANGTTPILGPDGVTPLSVTTDASGNYFFGNLPAGQYVVGVTPPTDWPTSSTTTSTADNQVDGNDNGIQTSSGLEAKSPVITLAVGTEPTTTENAPGTGGAQDNALDANGDMTVDFGFFAPVSIGSTVYNDANNNGTQDPTETGLAGAVVKLYKADGVTPATDINGNVITQVTTLADGNYYFPNLPPGDYVVGVTPPSTTPIISSTTVAADNQTDGDNNGGTQATAGGESKSPVINLNSGAETTTEASPGTGGALDNATPTADASGDMTIDFGFYAPVSIGSTVFFDADNDGTQDGTEPGMAGATVKLYYDANNNGVIDGAETTAIATAPVTNGTGEYYFGNLAPGNYQVGVTPPATYPISSTDISTTTADNQTDSDDNGVQSAPGGEAKSPIINLAAGAEPLDTAESGTSGGADATADNAGDMTVDFGFYAPVSIGSTVYNDANNNGEFDSTETGLAGATVKLYRDADGNGVLNGTELTPIATAPVTDGTGNYYFGNLAPGNYIVGVTPPVSAPVSSTNTVIADENDPNDPGDGLDNGTQSSAGAEAFSPVINLSAGNEPTGSTENSAANGGADDASGDSSGDMTVDFGFYAPVSIGSTVFFDENNDGVQQASEVGIAGAVVNLYFDANNNGTIDGAETTPVATNGPSGTTGTGNYFFGNLMPGTYVVGVVPPVLYPVSSTDIASTVGDNQTDADDNGVQAGGAGTEALSSPITLAAGTEPSGTTENGPGTGGAQDTASGDNAGDMTIDFGFYAPVSIGSTVFNDTNNNGIQDGTEAGIAGATVKLYFDANNNGVIDGAETTAIATAPITDGSGNYYFGNLEPGNYQVGVTPPPTHPNSSSAGVTVTTDITTDDGRDNGTQTTSGAEALSPVINLKANAEPTGSTELPQGIGGTQDDASGDASGDMTVDFGFYEPVSIGSNVFEDLNNSGGRDGSEPGLSGATVNLYFDANNDGTISGAELTPIATQTTGTTGDYLFKDLVPGKYMVGVVPPVTAPKSSTLTVTTDVLTDDTKDNGTQSAIGAEAFSPIVTLTPGVEGVAQETGSGNLDSGAPNLIDANGDMTVDFGFFNPVSIGSTVFIDTDNDGVHDTTEAGLAGATVKLYFDADGNGTIDGAETTAIATAPITTSSGEYYFGDLAPGNYVVGVTPPSTHPVSSTDIGTSTSDNQTDGDDNGVQMTTGGEAFSPKITLLAGSEPTGTAENETGGGTSNTGFDQDDATPLADAAGDMTVDFGFFAPVSIGSTVFIDANNDGVQSGVAETGITSATVNLYYDANGDGLIDGAEATTPYKTTTTDGSGNYLFSNIPEGKYQVGVVPVSAYPVSSTSPTTTDNQVDSNDDGTQTGSGLEAKSPIIMLSYNGETHTETGQGEAQDTAAPGGDTSGDMTVDFGFFAPVSIGSTVFIDSNNDGTQSGATELGISGATVNLYFDSNGDGNIDGTEATTPVATKQTDTNGNYIFTDIPAGKYIVGVVPVAAYPTSSTVPATTDNQVDGNDDGTQTTSGTEAKSPVITLTSAGETHTETAQGEGLDTSVAGGDTSGDMTVDFGFFAPMSIGSLVFLDKENNGFFDGASDTPILGAKVNLFEADGITPAKDVNGNLVGEVTTGTNGLYLFSNLLPGSYVVAVTPASSAPVSSTLAPTVDENGLDNADNGTQASSGAIAYSPVIHLIPGTEPSTFSEGGDGGDQDTALPGGDANGDMTVDFGFVSTVSIGSLVYTDADNNGDFNGTDAPLAGATVRLYDAAGNPAKDANGVLVPSQITDADGLYYFDNLMPGDYKVGVTPPLSTPAASTTVIPADENNPLAPGDGLNNGTQAVPGTGESISPVINLKIGDEPGTEAGLGGTQDTAEDLSGDMTVDFGFYKPVNVSGTVFNDTNGAGNPGSEDGSVTDQTAGTSASTLAAPLYANLVDADGDVVGTAPIDATNGTFTITNVPPGTGYTVVLSTTQGTVGDPAPPASLPAGYENTGEVNGTTGSDSGLSPDGESATFDVTTADVPNINFGVEKIPVAGNTSVTQVNPNGTVQSNAAGATLFGTDETPGTIKEIILPVFPIDATSITVNGTKYTTDGAGGTTIWPVGGLVLPTTSAFPTITVDPTAEGVTSVTLPYRVRDNAGFLSDATDPGTVTFTFTGPALPVILESFTARAVESGVNLVWKVSAEASFSHYEVERGISATEFKSINTVSASNKKLYSVIDTKAQEGRNYYRLKMVDNDGSFSYSSIVNIDIDSKNLLLTIQNPAVNGEFAMYTNAKAPKFSMHTATGQKVGYTITNNGAGKYIVKTNSANGVYYFLMTEAGKTLTKKIILH